MAIASVEKLLDVPIDHYVQLNMAGLKELIDGAGGIKVNSSLAFKQDGTQFVKGENQLDGNKALSFIRMRYEDPEGDFGRQKRQRDVIEATIEKLKSVNNLLHYQDVLQTISQNMKTDLSWEDMQGLVTHYRDAASHIKQYQLESPGELSDGSYGEKDIYYEHPAKEELGRIHKIVMEQLELE